MLPQAHPSHHPFTLRVADGTLSVAEAKQRNAAHYERFYGKRMPKNMLF
jgi:hypothetical protein